MCCVINISQKIEARKVEFWGRNVALYVTILKEFVGMVYKKPNLVQSQSYITTNSLSVSPSWYQALSIFFDSFGFIDVGRPL
jgi:hypothetical protein